MKTELFNQVSEVISARYSASLVVSLILSVVTLSQQYFIQTRAEIVVHEPMFAMDQRMKYVRGSMTQSVSEVWAYNAVMLFGNVNESSVALMDAISYSFVDSAIASRLKLAHEKQLALMASQQVTITFIPDGKLTYDEKSGWVTISGLRIVSPIDEDSDVPDQEYNYMYKVKMAMTGFRPWVSGWEEGVISE
jgi:hypothetical protein